MDKIPTIPELEEKIHQNIRVLDEVIRSFERRCLPTVDVNDDIESLTSLYLQLHIRRLLDLLKGVRINAEYRLVLPTILCARAFLETVAIFNAFLRDLKKAKDPYKRHEVIRQYTLQTRNKEYLNALKSKNNEVLTHQGEATKQTKHELDKYYAINMIIQIKKLDKITGTAQENYNEFSERCHPNCDGLFMLYATVVDKHISFEPLENKLNEILKAMFEVKESGKPFYEMLNETFDFIDSLHSTS